MTDRQTRIIGSASASSPALFHPRGNPLLLRVSARSDSLPVSPAASLRAEIRASQVDDGLPLATVQITNPTGSGPWDLRFSGAQMNQDLLSKKTRDFWLVVYFLAASGDRDTQYAAVLSITEDGASLSAAQPPDVELLLDQSTADTLYAPLSLLARVAALEYVPMAITALTAAPAVAEVGSTVTPVFSWTRNKPAAAQFLNGDEISNDVTSLNAPASISAQTVYTLTADDGTEHSGHFASRSVTVQFQHRAYWGVAADDAAPTSAAILALASSAFSTGRQREITVNAPAEGGHPVYVIPADHGEPTFMDGGFVSANWERVPINFQKANGNVTPYLWFRLRDRQFTTGIKFQVL